LYCWLLGKARHEKEEPSGTFMCEHCSKTFSQHGEVLILLCRVRTGPVSGCVPDRSAARPDRSLSCFGPVPVRVWHYSQGNVMWSV